MYTFLHVDFGGVEFYAVRRYVNLTKEGGEEDLFVIYEEEEDDELMTVSELPLLVKKGCVVLKFRIYHDWFQGIIQTLLLRKWLVSGAKVLLLTTTTTLTLKTFLSL